MSVNFACFDFFLVPLVADAFRETLEIWFKTSGVGEAVAGRGGACQACGLALVPARPGARQALGRASSGTSSGGHREEPLWSAFISLSIPEVLWACSCEVVNSGKE